jgi:histidinol-phosphate aminotransferase
MSISRRSFFGMLGGGAAAASVLPWPLERLSGAILLEPPRPQEPDGFVHLNSNENPYGPSQKSMQAIQAAISSANRYPYEHYDALTEKISAFHRVSPDEIVLGCGSQEILRVTAQAFVGPGKTLIQASPTFEALGRYSEAVGAKVVSLPLNHEYAHDLPAVGKQLNAAGTLVYICNPNNPTGSLTPRQDIEAFIARLPSTTTVVIDEAYHHFAGQSGAYVSFLEQRVNDDRIIVARTFSKVYGMAGLRLGYAVATRQTAKRLGKFLTQDSVNGVVVRAAQAALDDQASVQAAVETNTNNRQEFYNQCHARMLKPIDSHANFVMMDTHRPAADIIEHFRKNKVLIGRRFPPMDRHIRVSIGTPEDMLQFWRVWDMLPHMDMSM